MANLLEALLNQCRDWRFICWIEAHPGLAAYLQGLFSVLAVVAAIAIARHQNKLQLNLATAQATKEKQQQLTQARGIALLIRGDLDLLRRDALEALKKVERIPRVDLPGAIERVADQLWILESAGQTVVGVISLVTRQNEMSYRAQGVLQGDEMTEKSAMVLQGIADNSNKAVAEIDVLLNLPADQRRKHPPEQAPQ